MMEKIITNKLINFPLKCSVSFLLITFIMFIISPWDWKLTNPIIFYIFNFAVFIAFILGYKFAIVNYKYSAVKTTKINKWINRSIFIGLISIYPRFLVFHSVSSISISDVYNKVLLGILTPGLAYFEKSMGSTQYNSLSNPIALINMLTGPFVYFILFTGMYYWHSLSRIQKIGFLVILASHIVLYLSIGTNKGIFDLVIVFPFLLIAINPDMIRFTKRIFSVKRIFIIAISVVLITTALGFFAKGNKDRKQDYFYTNVATGQRINEDALILKLIPDVTADVYISLDSYLTQGYYALDLALGMDFMPTFGFGNSFFLTSMGEKVTGKNSISDRTYQHRIEFAYQYSHYGKWHTAYVWFANDVSFWLVPLVVFFIAYFLATAWIDLIRHNDIFAVSVFSMLIIMVFYLPANNQILGFQSSALTLVFFFFVWQVRRKNIHF
jgi:hypothetical protein